MFSLMDCVLDRLYGCGPSVILSVVIGGLVDMLLFFFSYCLLVGVVMNMIDL